jgi:hypothetical protein
MRTRRLIRWGAIPLFLALCFVLMPTTASAHERRMVGAGKYQFVVGFLNEPAVQSFQNGIDLTVTDLTQKDASGNGKPVDGLEKTLKAQVMVPNGAKRDVTLATRFGMPGKYAGYFVPTAPGSYMFRIYGAVGDQQIDETFSSGPNTFSDVAVLADQQFPVQMVVPVNAQAQIDSAQSTANTARILGIAGLAVGVLGLAVGVFALTRRSGSRTGSTVEQ